MAAAVIAIVCAAAVGLAGAPPAAAGPVARHGVAAASTPTAARADVLAAAAAQRWVAAHPSRVHRAAGDQISRLPVLTGGNGLRYVPFERTHRGLPVVGGDFVVVVNRAGRVVSASVAQSRPIAVPARPGITAARAGMVASAHGAAQRRTARTLVGSRMVVAADAGAPRLAWEVVVSGVVVSGDNGGLTGGRPSRLHVLVDALTGAVLRSYDEVSDGTGTGWINGQVSIATSGSGTAYAMTDPGRPGIACRDFTSSAVFTGTDDVWGNGVGTDRETGCVDALYAAQAHWDMLAAWLGRTGIDGAGGGYPVYVGLDEPNAYWDGTRVVIGRNLAGRWVSSLDIVGHELGHGVDMRTPGGISANGVAEATADILGTLTEAFAANAADPPDYEIGEEVNLVGAGPIRYMHRPSLVGDPDCYSATVPNEETHVAAGPFNHWFYLLAHGSAAGGGHPASPTCNGTSVSGVGLLAAGRIFYNAMLAKTTNMTYLKYRTATLDAARNLYPGDCGPFGTVKAAWDAVSVPAQAGDPTCTAGSGPVVTSPGPQAASVGVPVSLTLSATGGTTPYTWAAAGLPAGLDIDGATGVVSGVPGQAGSYVVTVTATGAGGNSGYATFAWTVSPSSGCGSPGERLANPGFESGNASWTASSGVIGASSSSRPARSGSSRAHLGGAGQPITHGLTQPVTIPAGCTATLSLWLRVVTGERTTTTAYDTVSLALGGSTLAEYSNLDASTRYVQRTFNVSSYAGRSVTLSLTATEDAALATSFLVDDLALTVT